MDFERLGVLEGGRRNHLEAAIKSKANTSLRSPVWQEKAQMGCAGKSCRGGGLKEQPGPLGHESEGDIQGR